MQQDPRLRSRSSRPQPEESIHLLLNALTVVRGNAQLIERRIRRPGSSDPEVLSASIGRIIDAADRMSRTVVSLIADSPPATFPRPAGDKETSSPDLPSPPSSTP